MSCGQTAALAVASLHCTAPDSWLLPLKQYVDVALGCTLSAAGCPGEWQTTGDSPCDLMSTGWVLDRARTCRSVVTDTDTKNVQVPPTSREHSLRPQRELPVATAALAAVALCMM
jgi:hypothetical protein